MTYNVSGAREHLEVLAGLVVALWCVFIIFGVVCAAVVKICNVKITLITIIIVVIILSNEGIFMWMFHPPIFLLVCLLPSLFVLFCLVSDITGGSI